MEDDSKKKIPQEEYAKLLRREIEDSINFLKALPDELKKELVSSINATLALPFAVAASNVRNLRILTNQMIKVPRFFVEDLRDIPDLTTRFFIQSPGEVRKEIREYLSWKKKERPLNVVDLLVDILDTILPG